MNIAFHSFFAIPAKLKISGGAVVGDPPTQIFVSSADYTLENSLYAGAVLTSHADNNIIPFFTDYPFVTMMDRPSDTEPANAIGVKESFFIKYILKPQPLSTGKYLVTFKPGTNFKVLYYQNKEGVFLIRFFAAFRCVNLSSLTWAKTFPVLNYLQALQLAAKLLSGAFQAQILKRIQTLYFPSWYVFNSSFCTKLLSYVYLKCCSG